VPLAGTNDAKQNRSLEQALIACEAVLDQCRAAGRFVYLGTLPGRTASGLRSSLEHERHDRTAEPAYRRIAAVRGLSLVDCRACRGSASWTAFHLSQPEVWVADMFVAAIEKRR